MHEPAFWYRPASWMSRFMMPLGAIYGAVAGHRLQRKGLDAGIPVLCVGNYHVGGAGKTPTVLALADHLRGIGETPVVLSRGYGAKLIRPVMVNPARHSAADVGDEPLMMAPRVPVVVSRDRVDGVALAKSRGPSVILMDDGFQNPAVAKDCSLIVIDSERGIGNGRVFPAGPLRAPLPPQLALTDALVVIGRGTASSAIADNVAARGGPVFPAHLEPDAASIAALKGKRVLAFAGIGDPARFFRTLNGCGVDVVRGQTFADHYPFKQRELHALLKDAKAGGLTLATTEKDFARLSDAADAIAHDVVPFKVTLQFSDAGPVRKFLSERLLRAREKRFRAP